VSLQAKLSGRLKLTQSAQSAQLIGGSWGFEADSSGRGAISQFSFGVEFLNILSHCKSKACCSLFSIPKPIVTIHKAIDTVF
jgi:hypothetical protein